MSTESNNDFCGSDRGYGTEFGEVGEGERVRDSLKVQDFEILKR